MANRLRGRARGAILYSHPSIWCMWLHVWLGSSVYDPSIDGAHLLCLNCGKVMDPFGRHSLSNCGSGYGRTARHNTVAKVSREEALVESGIRSRREETGLFPDADDLPGDIYVTK